MHEIFPLYEAREDPQVMALHQALLLAIPVDIRVWRDLGSEFPELNSKRISFKMNIISLLQLLLSINRQRFTDRW